MMPDVETLRRRIDALGPWFHNLRLPGGVETCPDHFLGDFPAFKWAAIAHAVPESLDGWTALDVGCNAGFYSFELARRGARVTAIDVDERYLDQARFAAGLYGLEERIDFRRLAVYDLARTDTRWDLVLFLGVFYHLRYPLLGLDAVARVTRRQLLFQSLVLPGEEVESDPDPAIHERERLLRPGWPRMSFVEGRLQNDPTNWWVPNHSAALAMLRSTGMEVIDRPAEETYLCRPEPRTPSSFWTWNGEEFRSASGTSPRRR